MENGFKKSLEVIFKLENSFLDNNGEIKFAITDRLAEELGYKSNKNFSKNKKELLIICYKNYWLENNYFKLEDDDIAAKVFVQALRIGPTNANQNLQRAYNLVSEEEIEVDGVVDLETLSAINNSDYRFSLIKLLDIIEGYEYIKMVEKDNKQKKFLRDWIDELL